MRKQQTEQSIVLSSSLVGDWDINLNRNLWGKEEYFSKVLRYQVEDRLRYYRIVSKTTITAVDYIDAGFIVVRLQVKDPVTSYRFVACWKLPSTGYCHGTLFTEIAIAIDHARRGLMHAKEQRWLHGSEEDCEIQTPNEQAEALIVRPKDCDYDFNMNCENYRLTTDSNGKPVEIVNLWSGEVYPRGSKEYWKLITDYAKATSVDSNFLTS